MSTVVSNLTDRKVETVARFARWKPQYDGSSQRVQSDVFKIGIWSWQLAFEVEKQVDLVVRLSLQRSPVSETQLPWARFIIRVVDSRRSKFDSGVEERVFGNGVEHSFSVTCYIQGRFVIDLEFSDLRISQGEGTNTMPLLPLGGEMENVVADRARRILASIHQQNIYPDAKIITPDGTVVEAHRAILAASSPVFTAMFFHDMVEKAKSTVDLQAMTQQACMAFIAYLYGNIYEEDFLANRLALLLAADLYQVDDLRNLCEKSLLEDIDLDNALDRLQEAWTYKLDKLKDECFKYLFVLEKVHDIPEVYRDFLRKADRDLTRQLIMDYISR